MQFTLDTEQDFPLLSASVRREIVALMTRAISTNPETEPFMGIDMAQVADLTFRQVQKWMEAASPPTKKGLQVVAELGPVIRARDLADAGIANIGHFQSRTTIRTRTVTGDKDLYLFGWDDWEVVEEGEGRYAVTPITHESLRRYFKLDHEGDPS